MKTADAAHGVTVRHLSPADYPILRNWMRDPAIRSAIEDETIRPGKPSRTLEMFAASDPFSRGDLCLIFEKDSRPIGLIHFVWINWVSRNAEVVVFIGPEGQRGSSLAFRAIEKIGSVAFNTLNLHKIYAFIYASNLGSLRLFRRLMKTEACLRSYLKAGEGYEDVFMLGMLSSEYRAIIDKMKKRFPDAAEVD